MAGTPFNPSGLLQQTITLTRVGLRRQFRSWRWWWLLMVIGQALFAAIILVAFARLFPRPGHGSTAAYALSVYAGIVVWSLIQDSALQAVNLYREHRSYIMRFRVPLWSYAIGASGVRALILLTGVVVLVVARLVIAGDLTWRLLLLIPMLPAIVATGIGIAWLAAAAATLEQRLQHLLPHLMLLWFFATPVVYPRAALPPRLQLIGACNPATHLVECFQSLWLSQISPGWQGWLISVVTVTVVVGCGFLVTRAYSGRIIDSL
jgi:lipopolysaccharide transport system permease protein